MFFGRRKPAPLAKATRMGFRSRLVLEKLGFDLRERYGEPMQDLPEHLRGLTERLDRSFDNDR